MSPGDGQRFTPDLESSGEATGDRCRLHPRQLANAVEQLANEGRARHAGIAGLRQVDRHQLDTARIETRDRSTRTDAARG